MGCWRISKILLAAVISGSGAGPRLSPEQARALEQRGDWAGAAAAWRALAQASPGDYRLWTDLGVALAHLQRYAEAVAAYRKALRLQPAAMATQMDLGIAFFKQGDFAHAAAAFQSPAKIPGNTQAAILLALSLYGAHDYQAAIPHLETLAAAAPDNSELLEALAESYLYTRQFAKAKQEFEIMLRRNPDSPGVHMLLAQADDSLNRTADAVAELRAALAHGYVPNAHFGIGYIAWRGKRYDEAAAEFRRELASAPQHAQALAYLGDVLLRSHDPSARTTLEKAVALDDAIPVAHLDLGILDAGAHQNTSARKQFERAIELAPDDADAHYRLARLYQAEGQMEDAEAQLAIVTRLHEARQEHLIEKISGPQPQVQ
jgi:tetratricopeptide (TPR) repeat protein